MTRWNKAALAGVFMLFASFFLLAILAVGSDPAYTYTVRFFAGQQGTFGGSEVVTYENLNYGDRVTFHQSSVTLKDGSKYYVKGIRESGKDNNTATATSFVVTGDQDYVVAYGILGSAVAYTVQYQDADGNTLAPSETYYGNVGDQPVIAYLYIDGYQPQAYNLRKTLSQDAGENVFTFVYTPVSQTTYLASDTAAPGATVPPELRNAQNTADQTDAADTEPNSADDRNGQTDSEPWEIIDLDDPDTPLANLELSDTSSGTESQGWPRAVLYGVLAAGALLCLAVVFLIWKKKKQQEQEPESHG